MKKLKFGVVGTGRIAQQFLDEVKNINEVEVIGVCARNFEKTKEVANEYEIENPYENTTDMFENDEIEAIYIATMHPTHFPYTIKALKAGKHVLCEKPAVLKAEELDEVIALAKKKDLLFMEAITIGFNPMYQKVKEIIENNEIGKIVHVESSFGSKSTKKHKHNPKQAGGALYDIGIYNLFLLTDLLGTPNELNVISRDNKWGVDGSITGIFNYPSTATGSIYATMDSISGNSAKIIGTDGMIELNDTWTMLESFTVKKLGQEPKEYKNKGIMWLTYELKSFVETIFKAKDNKNTIENKIMTYEKSMELHKNIDMVKNKLGFKYNNLEDEIK